MKKQNMINFSRVLLLLTLSSVGSFAYAVLEYSPATLTYPGPSGVFFDNPTSSCHANYDATTNAIFSEPDQRYFCQSSTQYYGFISQVAVCPLTFERDSSKSDFHPQACFKGEVPPSDCLAKAGNEFILNMACATVTCLGTWDATSEPGKTICDGVFDVNPKPIPSPISQSGCKANFAAMKDLKYYGPTTAPSDSAVDASCDVVYKYTGEPEAADAPPPPAGATTPNSTAVLEGASSGTGAAPPLALGTAGTGATTVGTGEAPGISGDCVATAKNPCNGTGIGEDGGTCDPVTQSCGSSYGSGTCEVKPKCTGDAVMCGIIHQNWIDTCALMKNPTTEEKQTVEDQKKTFQIDYDQRTHNYNKQVTSYFSGFKGAATGGQYQGQCPADKSFSAMGRTFTLKVSEYCDYFRIFRFFVLAFAYLSAARIIFSSV